MKCKEFVCGAARGATQVRVLAIQHQGSLDHEQHRGQRSVRHMQSESHVCAMTSSASP